MTGTNSAQLDAFYKHLRRGWSVIPVSPGSKKPLIRWKRYQEAPASREQIEEWLEKWPDANPGAVSGMVSQFVVLDVDGSEGEKTLTQLGRLPRTPKVRTGRGWHYYFKHPGRPVRNFVGELPGLDLRGDGGYVVAAGATHESGRRYEWEVSPEEAPLADLPPWLFELIEGKNTPPEAPEPAQDGLHADSVVVRQDGGTSPHHVHLRYAEVALEKEIAALERARQGERNNTLNKAAFALGQLVAAGVLDKGEVEARLYAAAVQLSLHRDGRGSRQVEATIRSGLEAGMAQPRILPSLLRTESLQVALKRTHAPVADDDAALSEQEDVIEPADGGEPTTDMGNGERLIRYFGHLIRYSQAIGWLYYDGKKWQHGDLPVRELGKLTVRLIYGEAIAAESQERREALSKHAVRSEASRAIDAMLRQASSDPRITIHPSALDSDPWLFNCDNGIIDLRTGELLPHSPGHLLSKISPVAYDPSAAAPTWERFIHEIFEGSAGVSSYIRRVAGYAMTGLTTEQVWFVLWGVGSNGKSTLLSLLYATFGDYAQNTTTDMFLMRRGDTPTNDLARLVGARFVSASESGEGRRLDEARIKQLTGGDPITCRFLHREFFDFVPALKLLFGANHKPRISGTDYAIWRRVRLIPFLHTWYGPNERGEPKRDNSLKTRLLVELPGILAWAVRGCLEWQREGLADPPAVLAATEEYRDDSDVVGNFLEDCCETLNGISGMSEEDVLIQGWSVTSSDLYRAYTTWCESEGEKPQTQRWFAPKLEERGFVSKRGTGGTRSWWGLKLRG
jgi:putative DNA primase/helicase